MEKCKFHYSMDFEILLRLVKGDSRYNYASSAMNKQVFKREIKDLLNCFLKDVVSIIDYDDRLIDILTIRTKKTKELISKFDKNSNNELEIIWNFLHFSRNPIDRIKTGNILISLILFPFLFIAVFSVRALTDNLETSLEMFAGIIVFLILAFSLEYWLWKRGLKQYESFGG